MRLICAALFYLALARVHIFLALYTFFFSCVFFDKWVAFTR